MAIREPIIIDADVTRVQDDGAQSNAHANAQAKSSAGNASQSAKPAKSMSKMKRVLIVLFTLVYVLSPLDILPEFLMGPVGLLDDLGVLAWAARQLFFRRDA
jgi:uncharacterized membrane protein YkvA (DUF1232 family)